MLLIPSQMIMRLSISLEEIFELHNQLNHKDNRLDEAKLIMIVS